MTADADMAPYSAARLMQLSISRSLAQRPQGTNVTVNSLLPGCTVTPGGPARERRHLPQRGVAAALLAAPASQGP